MQTPRRSQRIDWQPTDLQLSNYGIENGKLLLLTTHRRENFGKPLKDILEAIQIIANEHPEYTILFPSHPNPNVQKAVSSLKEITNVKLIAPLQYDEFVPLMAAADLILTDSGGIQEEAPGLGKPVLVMRDTTERPEAVEAGTVELVGSDKKKIVKGISRLLNNKKHYQKMSRAHNPYGDGLACKRIVDVLQNI